MTTKKKPSAGGRRAPAPKAAPKATAPKPAVPAVASAGSGALLVSTAKGLRVFQDGQGLRRFIAAGEVFQVDAATARLLLATDPEAFAKASDAPIPEAAPAATGPVTVADLGEGGRLAPDAPEASEVGSSEASPADAAAAASSGGDDQGGSEPADDPGAAAFGEAGTPPSSEATAAGEPGAVVLS